MVPSEVEVLQRAIWKWANTLMPERTAADAIKKLSMEEVPELWRSFRETNEIDPDELADILIIVFDLCEMANVNALEVIHEKMAINIQRKWNVIHGVLQHED
jgi:NTP pyrophosphatase (non-canonical NTP hydrolase)